MDNRKANENGSVEVVVESLLITVARKPYSAEIKGISSNLCSF
jgi:hypothetical protein